MKKDWRSTLIFCLIVVLFFGMGIFSPVYATDLRMNISLGKTYAFKLANVSQINVVDIADYSATRIDINTTSGLYDDIKLINTPTIRNVRRDFTTTSGTFNDITITITGGNPSTVDWTNKPEFIVYTKYTVPTFYISGLPGRFGNPLVTKYNESWSKGDTDNLDSLFRSSESAYLYDWDGVVHINTTNNIYTGTGGFVDSSRYNQNNITFTLERNLQSLSPFVGNQSTSEELGWDPKTLPTKGKYFISSIRHREPEQNVTVSSLSSLIILQDNTRMNWTVGGTDYPAALPPYTKGTSGPVTLNFSPLNTDVNSIKNITYFIVNKTVIYDMNVTIDTSVLAQNAESLWQSAAPTYQFSELLYSAITTDIGPGWNYTLTADGGTIPPASTQWSVIAITPGYGISGSVKANEITVPALNMTALDDGAYYVYLMGTDIKNDVIAIDQKQVVVTSGGPTNIPVINVTVRDVNGAPLYANNIRLFNGTWSDNTTWMGTSNASFEGLALEQYTVMARRAGYVNVTGNVTVTGENPRWVNITLAQLGELYIPRVVLSENGTTVSGIARIYRAPTGALNGNSALGTKEFLRHSVTITGNDAVVVGAEFLPRLSVSMAANGNQPYNATLDDVLISSNYKNGTFVIDTSAIYTTTNATLLANVPVMSDGKTMNMTFAGTLKGDATGDGIVLPLDASWTFQCYLRTRLVLPTYDYADVAGTTHQFIPLDASWVFQNYMGTRNF